jgi:hypothetical protein
MSDYQVSLFYDDAYDALEKSIAASGKTKKEIAASCYPGRSIETAKSLLSRALSPENTDVHLCICTILTVMHETRPDDIIFYLCDEFGFNRPDRKNEEQFEKEIRQDLRGVSEVLKVLTKKLDSLGKVK